MKIFSLKEQTLALLERPEIIAILSDVEYYKGRVYNLPNRLKLNRLHSLSKRKSVTSSNEIEGIKVGKAEEEALFLRQADPQKDEGKLLMGYNNALEHIFKVYSYQELDERFIRHLSALIWELINPKFGWDYKDHQNYIRDFFPDGTSRTVFIPLKPEETSQALGNLIWQFNDALSDYKIPRLPLIFIFVLDFLCIHPFNDGNGRVSRLLTTYLLLKYGYELDRYYSTSYLILKRLERYYASLEESSKGWHENQNDVFPFVSYMLSVLLEGYKKLDYIKNVASMRGTLKEKAQQVIQEANEPLSKTDIEEILFSYKRSSLEEALGKLKKEGKIQLIQKGRYALYWKV